MILDEVSKVKPCGMVQLGRYMKRFQIRPMGVVRMRPLMYPDDSARLILRGLGLDQPAADQAQKEWLTSGKVITMGEIRNLRAARKGVK